MNRGTEWNVISPDVGEDDVRNKDGGCPVQNEDTKNL
jgi:hypothetical protein